MFLKPAFKRSKKMYQWDKVAPEWQSVFRSKTKAASKPQGKGWQSVLCIVWYFFVFSGPFSFGSGWKRVQSLGLCTLSPFAYCSISPALLFPRICKTMLLSPLVFILWEWKIWKIWLLLYFLQGKKECQNLPDLHVVFGKLERWKTYCNGTSSATLRWGRYRPSFSTGPNTPAHRKLGCSAPHRAYDVF